MDSILYLIFSYLLALILLFSVLDKIKNWKKSHSKVEAYGILPSNLIKPLNFLFVILELYLCLVLITKQPHILDIMLFILIMGIYTSAIAINLHKGHVQISCGCGGVLESNRLTPFLIYRNLCLIIIALILLSEEKRNYSTLESIHAMLLASILLLLFGAYREFRQQTYIIEKVKSKLPFFT